MQSSNVPLMHAVSSSDVHAGILPAVKSDQARIIAQTNLTRMKEAPEVPAISETIPDFNLPNTQSLFARTGTPIEIASKLTAVVKDIVQLPEIQERFKTLGLEASVRGPAEAAEYQRNEATRIEKIVQAAGLKPN